MRSRTTLLFLTCMTLAWIQAVYGETGLKMKTGDILFSGQKAYKDWQLRKIMVTRPARWYKKYTFNREVFEEDMKSIELFYHRNGYLDASITEYHVDADTTLLVVNPHIMISEGERTFWESVTMLGNNAFPDSLLLARIDLTGGTPYRQARIEDAALALLTFYANNGYLDAEVNPEIRINKETHRALIDFNITENGQYRIGAIVIEGLEKTKRYVVERELRFQSGDIINYSQLLLSQRNIYLTGLFESAHIRPKELAENDSIHRDIIVTVKENLAGEFNISLGYGSEDRARTKLEVLNHNIRGTSLKLGGMARLSSIQRGVETSLTYPWTFGRPISSDLNAYAEQKFKPGYDLERYGGRFILGRKFREHRITTEYKIERHILSNIKTSIESEDQTSNMHSVKLSYIFDTRNNLFNASKGFYFELSNEAGIFYSNNKNGFYRISGKVKYFLPLAQNMVLGSSLELGMITVNDKNHGIPLHELFYAGGSNSIRGFSYEKVGPLNSRGIPVGGMYKAVWNIFELRRPLYKMIGGVLFADAGTVWEQWDDVDFDEVRIVPGLGLRVNTPIGLARLDYGFNIDKRPAESPGKLHFSLGQAF